MGSDTIRFDLEGTAEGWVAVGVSADRVMGTDGIDDVFVCQRANDSDTVTAEDAYNPQDQTVSPRVNSRDSVSVSWLKWGNRGGVAVQVAWHF